jgi:hypothetical protein
MEMAVLALGIARVGDFEGNTEGSFGDLIYQTALGER